MNSKHSLLTSLTVFVVGIIFIILHNHIGILPALVVILGVMFILPGLYNLVCVIAGRGRFGAPGASRASAGIAAVAAIGLGLWMVVSPEFFVGLIAYVFAAVLVFIAVYQIIDLAYWSRPIIMPGYLYILPVLTLIAGIVILCTSVRTLNNVFVLITGICLVAAGLNSLLEYMSSHPARNAGQKRIE